MSRSRRIFFRIPTIWGSAATSSEVQNSETLGLRERWDGKVAGRPRKEELVGIPPFDDLIRTYGPELRRFVTLKVEGEAVDDVVQEVWVAVWQGYSSLQSPLKLRSWIYGICLHKCHDHYRGKQKDGHLVTLTDLEILDPSPSPEGLAIDATRIAILLENLDESQREVIELYYYAQLTLAEISDLLQRNMNTVKYQFYRAHAMLLATGKREELL